MSQVWFVICCLDGWIFIDLFIYFALQTHTPSHTDRAICKCQPWLLCMTVIDGLVSAVKVIASVLTSLPQLSCRSSPFRRPSSITHTHARTIFLFCPLNSLLCSSVALRSLTIMSLTVSWGGSWCKPDVRVMSVESIFPNRWAVQKKTNKKQKHFQVRN